MLWVGLTCGAASAWGAAGLASPTVLLVCDAGWAARVSFTAADFCSGSAGFVATGAGLGAAA